MIYPMSKEIIAFIDKKGLEDEFNRRAEQQTVGSVWVLLDRFYDLHRNDAESDAEPLKVAVYCINAGTSSEYYGLKNAEENTVLQPFKSWKTARSTTSAHTRI